METKRWVRDSVKVLVKGFVGANIKMHALFLLLLEGGCVICYGQRRVLN